MAWKKEKALQGKENLLKLKKMKIKKYLKILF